MVAARLLLQIAAETFKLAALMVGGKKIIFLLTFCVILYFPWENFFFFHIPEKLSHSDWLRAGKLIVNLHCTAAQSNILLATTHYSGAKAGILITLSV